MPRRRLDLDDPLARTEDGASARQSAETSAVESGPGAWRQSPVPHGVDSSPPSDRTDAQLETVGWRVYSHLAERVRALSDELDESAQQIVNAVLDRHLPDTLEDAEELMRLWRRRRPSDRRRGTR